MDRTVLPYLSGEGRNLTPSQAPALEAVIQLILIAYRPVDYVIPAQAGIYRPVDWMFLEVARSRKGRASVPYRTVDPGLPPG